MRPWSKNILGRKSKAAVFAVVVGMLMRMFKVSSEPLLCPLSFSRNPQVRVCACMYVCVCVCVAMAEPLSV